MKFSFQALPAETTPRPVVPVSFPDLPKVQLLGLVDSGALGTRISDEIADALEIDLSEAETRTFRVGGLDSTAAQPSWTSPSVATSDPCA